MTELRLTGNDGEHLILESGSGDRFRLPIDDSLKTAIRLGSQGSTASVAMSPREIQSEIRFGSSVDDLVARSGDPRNYIEKFAAPVLDELSHLVSSARGVRISIAGDRHTDVSQIEFGDVISGRLDASGVHESEWSARRDEQQIWLVSISYELGDETQKATWSFDPKRLILAPENEFAVRLSTQNSLVAASYSPLRAAPDTESVSADQGITQALGDTQLVETVIPLGRAREFIEVDDEEMEPPTDLLEALKKKREERTARDSEQIEPAVTTQTIELVSLEGEQSQIEEIAPNPAPIRRSGRPSIPSFDEIVQGTKSEDE